MESGELRGLLRRAFLVGYDCGRADERDERELNEKPTDNLVSLDAHRDTHTRKEANA